MRQLAIPATSFDQRKQLIHTEKPTSAPVQVVEHTPQGTLVACGTALHQVDLGRFEIGKKIARMKAPITSVSLRRDGELAVLSDEKGGVQCSIVSQQTQLKRLYGLRSAATVVKFTPDGYSVLAGTKGGEVVVWDLPTGDATFAVRLCADAISDVCFLDGDRAVVSSLGGTLHWINFRLKAIEVGVSEARPCEPVGTFKLHEKRVADKVTKLALFIKLLFVVAGDFVLLMSPEERKEISRS